MLVLLDLAYSTMPDVLKVHPSHSKHVSILHVLLWMNNTHALPLQTAFC